MKSCFLVKRDIVVVYVYPAFAQKYDDLAQRFVAKYKEFTPAMPHRILVVSNGAQPHPRMKRTFEDLQVTWGSHDNSGYDIGAYQWAAKHEPCHLMVFFGASGYPRHPEWLDRLVASESAKGIGLYGTMGNMGNPGAQVFPHIRTTGFMVQPELLNAYPYPVVSPTQRYPFEHGRNCLSEFCRAAGLPRIVVAACGEYDYPLWNSFPNGFFRGDQSNLLTGDRLTDPPFYAGTSKE